VEGVTLLFVVLAFAVLGAAAWWLGRRCGADSGSQRHAYHTLPRQSVAAMSPGAAIPRFVAREPMAGPIITPALVAADSQPNALARSLGSMASPTYACATPVVPPPAPCTRRDNTSIHGVTAKANTRKPSAEAVNPTSSAGRRP